MRLAGLLLAALLVLPAAAGAEPIVVVVSSAWRDATSIDISELHSIYLGRRARWAGERVRRLELYAGSRARAGFSRWVLGRSESELERYWIEQALSGGALPPRQMSTPEALVDAVRADVGAMGFLPWASVGDPATRGVRILAIRVGGVERGIDDPSYPLVIRDAESR